MSFGMNVPTPQNFQWRSASGGTIPPNGVFCGYDAGQPIYVGRAYHSGALIPGKVHPAHGCCYVPWGGKENACRQYEVLITLSGAQPSWQPAYANQLPPGAFHGGRTEDGEPLYIGRHMHDGTMVPGKVQLSHSCLYIPFGGKEHSYGDYEVLIASPAGGPGPYGYPTAIPVQPYPGFPSYPENPAYPGYPAYPGNQPGTCPRWPM